MDLTFWDSQIKTNFRFVRGFQNFSEIALFTHFDAFRVNFGNFGCFMK